MGSPSEHRPKDWLSFSPKRLICLSSFLIGKASTQNYLVNKVMIQSNGTLMMHHLHYRNFRTFELLDQNWNDVKEVIKYLRPIAVEDHVAASYLHDFGLSFHHCYQRIELNSRKRRTFGWMIQGNYLVRKCCVVGDHTLHAWTLAYFLLSGPFGILDGN